MTAAPHPRRRAQMIHDGIGFVESLRCEDMLVSDAFVFERRRGAVAMEPDVVLPRNFAERVIYRHSNSPSVSGLTSQGPGLRPVTCDLLYKFPLAACSRSIASNSALKFPFPKLLAPLRWMIS